MSNLPRMGHRPALDGLRGLSVAAVVAYHAGLPWMSGGWIGVEVFFVVSGFLITTLLLEEVERTGRVDLREFWRRRAWRLLPAVAVLLVVVGVWGLAAGGAAQADALRRDLPWAALYVANWGQVLGDVPYYGASDPPLLRHLWSLAVEEQWYVVWPLAVAGTISLRRSVLARWVAVAALLAAALQWWVVAAAGADGVLVLPVLGPLDAVNVAYLSTPTRASGLLAGAAAAMVWRPWRSASATQRTAGRRRRMVGNAVLAVALAVLFATAVAADLTASVTYPWVLGAVTLASLVATAVAVDPAAVGPGGRGGLVRWLEARPLTWLGRRSYGWYLWHWPVFVVAGATDGDPLRVTLATAASLVLQEVSYRFVETPLRRRGRVAPAPWRTRTAWHRLAPLAAIAVVAPVAVAYARLEPFRPQVGGDVEVFVAPTPEGGVPTVGDTGPADVPDGTGATSSPAATPDGDGPDPRPVGGADLPADGDVVTGEDVEASDPEPDATARPAEPAPAPSATSDPAPVPAVDGALTVAVVGDSQAQSLYLNAPAGMDSTFRLTDGSVNGCSVHSSGRATSSRGVSTTFARCTGWEGTWARAADGADVALVVLGAWDVLDIVREDRTDAFGAPAHDAAFAGGVQRGIDAMRDAGVGHVALLEVPCMRPVDVEGAGVPALPERGDDARVAHLNGVLSGVAAGDPAVTFVRGPVEWCGNESIATSLDYRWDGVHPYRPGAKLVFETIAADLLRLGAPEPAGTPEPVPDATEPAEPSGDAEP